MHMLDTRPPKSSTRPALLAPGLSAFAFDESIRERKISNALAWLCVCVCVCVCVSRRRPLELIDFLLCVLLAFVCGRLCV